MVKNKYKNNINQELIITPQKIKKPHLNHQNSNNGLNNKTNWTQNIEMIILFARFRETAQAPEEVCRISVHAEF